MSFAIEFFGATRTVTGSCFLVEAGDTKFLVDMGMYQGPDVEIRNFAPFDFDPKEIDFVLLTHAHLDHVGLMPKLIKHGFDGKIYATMHSVQIGEIILRDSAKIQENNYSRGIPWKFSKRVELVYDKRDADRTIGMFEVVDFNEEFSPTKDVTITPRVAGHILGAASYEIEHDGKVVVFSGDIGRKNQGLIEGFDLDYKKEVDYVVMESLYGGKKHPNRSESVAQLMDQTRKTLDRGGSVFIPCFSVQRTQEIINDFRLAKQSGAIANDIPIWLDSPMAQKVTKIYADALDHAKESHFNFPNMGYVRYHRKSQKISKRKGQIIIAGSGMAEGGRILGHILGNIQNEKNSFIFVGYQAEKTLGREIVEGAEQITVDESRVTVKADIMHLQGFSAHGDTKDYEAWLERYNSPSLKNTFLVHADIDAAKAMEGEMNKAELDHPYIPKKGERVELT